MIYLIGNSPKLNFSGYSDLIQPSLISNCIGYCNDLNEISIDLETEGLDPHKDKIISIQLGDYNNQYVIQWNNINPSVFKNLFLDESKTFLFHNAKFDLKFLLHNGIKVENVYDTFLAECILTTGYEKTQRRLGLDSIADKYLNVYLDKSVRSRISKTLTDEVVIYAANDIKYLSNIKSKQIELINKYELEKTLDLENKVVKVFSRMEYNGITLDTDKWVSIAKKVESIRDNIENELHSLLFKIGSKDLPKPNKFTKYCNIYKQGNLFGESTDKDTIVNWKSNKQKLEIVRELGLDMKSVADEELQNNVNNHEIIPLLISFSKYNKLADAFGYNYLDFINPVTKRIHYDIWQILSTGRISTSNPNLNQIPARGELGAEIRSAFVPQKGYKMVGGDYNAMELRIIAEFSQDPTWVEAFKNGEDLHSKLCALTFNIPIEKVNDPFPHKPDLTYRHVQKTINFGLAYGMSKFKLSNNLQITVDDAEKIIKKFFSAVPNVEVFLNTLSKLGTSRGYIRSGQPYKRIRFFPEWKKSMIGDKKYASILSSIERKSKNMPIQATNGNVIKKALILIQNEIDKNNYPVNILLSVYDEIQTECREDFAAEWVVILEKLMIEAGKESIKTIPIKCDCSISDYWTK